MFNILSLCWLTHMHQLFSLLAETLMHFALGE
jgi:hypothetical protein